MRTNVVFVQWVGDGLTAVGAIDGDGLGGDQSRQGRLALVWGGCPVPVRESHGVGGGDHIIFLGAGEGVCDFHDHLEEFLLVESHVGTVPCWEKDGIVGAVAVCAAALLALGHAVPVLARNTVNGGDAVVGGPVALAALLELLHCQNEKCPLVRAVRSEVADFETGVSLSIAVALGARGDHDVGVLSLCDVVKGLVAVVGVGIVSDGAGGEENEGGKGRSEMHNE